MRPDILDEAAELTQLMIDTAIQNRSHPKMTFTGSCYYCEEKVQVGCFCSAECCEDYQRIERAKQQRKVA